MCSRIVAALLMLPAIIHAQAPDCDPAAQACFDVRFELAVADELPREGYERPTINRYQAQELEVYRQLRMDATPYTCTSIGGEDALSGATGTDVDHIVALAEAHDSGLAAADMLDFSGDPLNLTLATQHENRTAKNDRDAADYLPEHNQCWFAGRVIAVKQKWGLSVDSRETQFLKTALADCTPVQIAQPTCAGSTPPTPPTSDLRFEFEPKPPTPASVTETDTGHFRVNAYRGDSRARVTSGVTSSSTSVLTLNLEGDRWRWTASGAGRAEIRVVYDGERALTHGVSVTRPLQEPGARARSCR